MNIGIIGAGFTGLSAAYYLQKKGHAVTIFERDSQVGGLAIGYQKNHWKWSLEHHYHHWFTNDSHVLHLAKEIDHPVIITRPKTSVYVHDSLVQLDSPQQLFRFPFLSPVEKIRMAATLGLLRYNPIWQPFESILAAPFLQKAMGKKGYELIWKPQLTNKFGQYVDEMSLAWFWARIKKRTSNLAYPEGGFLHFANHLAENIKDQGGEIFLNHEITSLTDSHQVTLKTTSKNGSKTHTFDAVIVTLPTPLFLKIAPSLPKSYKNSIADLKGIGASNIVLRLKKPFFQDNTYWLSICDPKAPVMAIVEHTNFMSKKNYGHEHLVYLGNYLAPTDPNFSKTKEELLKMYDPYLEKINPHYKKDLIGYELFKAPFAQPIVTTHYSKKIPPIITPFKHTFLANIQQVYPWDRGTNYAVELGKKAIEYITK